MPRISFLFLFLLTYLSIVLGNDLDAAILRQERKHVKRQINLSTGGSSSSPSSSSSVSSADSSSSSSVSQSSSVVDTSSTVSITSSPSISLTTSTSTRTPSSSASVTSDTSSSSASTSFSQFTTSSVSQVLATYVTTEGGSTITKTRTSSTAVAVTSSSAVAATGLAANGKSSSSGLSSSDKKIIGGVVGGIGGALVLGALAFTVWKVWGKKRNLHDDDLYDPNANNAEKLSTTEQPFRSTLDQYHNPGPVNASSNF